MSRDYGGFIPEIDETRYLEPVYDEYGGALSEICHTLSESYDDGLTQAVTSIDDESIETDDKVRTISEFMNKFCNKGEGSLVDTFIGDLLEAGDVAGQTIFRGIRLSKGEIFERVVSLSTDIDILSGRVNKLDRILSFGGNEDAILDEAINYLNEFKILMEEVIDLMKSSLDLFKITVH